MSRPVKLVVATGNLGKLVEIKEALADLDVRLLSLADFPSAPEVIEDRATFEANAIKKAQAIAKHTGLISLADDSGLQVDALNGAPGVYSARYADPQATDQQNNDKLLLELKSIPLQKRTAHFRCVIAVSLPDMQTHTVDGSCSGIILETPRGQNGFGYDPLFLDPPSGLTFAQMNTLTKLKISHRGRALMALRESLPHILGQTGPA